jgi:hypothetical protein
VEGLERARNEKEIKRGKWNVGGIGIGIGQGKKVGKIMIGKRHI